MPNTISRPIRAASRSTLAALFSLGMLAAPVKAQSIDTTINWDGSPQTFWGNTGSAAVGQTITAPNQASVLQGFSFFAGAPVAPRTVEMYVYEWDAANHRATGQALYASQGLSIQTPDELEKITASGLNLDLVPGKQYVLFGRVVDTLKSSWGYQASGGYAGSEHVFIFDENGTWTGSPWRITSWNTPFIANIAYVGLPAAPILTFASRGDGQATFTVNLSDPGSAPLKHFTVGCTPQGGGSTVSTTNTSSPVTVTGLTNGTTYDCTAAATNQDDLTGSASTPVSVTPISAPAIADPGTLPIGRVNQPYSLTLHATGGVAPYAWSATGLPADLTINPVTGVISGTPTAAGTSQFTVTVTDDAGQEKTTQFTIVVDPLDLTVTSQTLPGGQVGQAYSASIAVAGGVAPYSFTLTGSLPEGLTLNPTTGAITGTPIKAQTSTFSITIEDSTLLPQSAMAKAAVHSVTQSFSITIAAAPVVTTPTPVPTLGEWGVIALSSLLAMFGLARSRRRQG